MRRMLKITKREYLAAVRTKAFLVGLLLAPLLLFGGMIAMTVFGDQVDTRDRTIVLVDYSGLVGEAVIEAAEKRNQTEILDESSGSKVKPAYFFELLEVKGESPDEVQLRLSEDVRKKEIYGFVEIGANVLHPKQDDTGSRITYHADNAAMDEFREWVAQPINQALRNHRLKEAGVDPEPIKDLFEWITVTPMSLVSKESDGSIKTATERGIAEAVGVPMTLMMLLFLMVMMGAVPQLSSVMEEKNQKIAEVILGSVRPFEFMMGKVLGGIAVSMTGSIVYVLVGVLSMIQIGFSGQVPYHVIPWFFVFMLLAILMMGSFLAALGSACNDAKDAQNLTLPGMLPVMVPMFLMVPVMKEPMSGFATWLSLFPPFTPLLMVLRMSTPGGVPAWQPWVGLFGVLLLTIVIVWAGGRVFRVGILLQGQAPRWSQLVRWALRG